MAAELIQLGENMWKSPGAKRGGVVPVNIKDPAIAEDIERYYLFQEELGFDETTWREVSARFRAVGVNTIVIDLGEGIVYPSHPELAIRGSWSPKKLRIELDRLHAMGFETIPKLNFSCGHNAWMGPWRRMVASEPYYRFCEDLIADVVEIFDRPRFFHIGADEEKLPPQTSKAEYVCVRQGNLWFHDVEHLIRTIEQHGVRAWMWADVFWDQPELFVKRIPRSVLVSNWYYRAMSDETLRARGEKWFQESVKRRDAYLGLDQAGYEQVPCASNFYDVPRVMEDTGVYAREKLSPERVKGLMMASWYGMRPVVKERLLAGAGQLAEAVRLYRKN